MTNHRKKQNYNFRTWKFRDRCHLKGGVRQGCFLSLILNNLIQYIQFHSLYIMSHYYAKFKDNPCVGTDASTPLHGFQILYKCEICAILNRFFFLNFIRVYTDRLRYMYRVFDSTKISCLLINVLCIEII